ncbi:6829_t:CDS:2, partial [Gigaspora margarita]
LSEPDFELKGYESIQSNILQRNDTGKTKWSVTWDRYMDA